MALVRQLTTDGFRPKSTNIMYPTSQSVKNPESSLESNRTLDMKLNHSCI